MRNRARKKAVFLYLSDEEYDLLKKKTENAGLHSMADYIRQMIIFGITYTVDFKELHQYNWLLSNLTNNLNQIAHQANSSGMTTNSDLREARRIMEEVWQLQKSMQSDLLSKNL